MWKIFLELKELRWSNTVSNSAHRRAALHDKTSPKTEAKAAIDKRRLSTATAENVSYYTNSDREACRFLKVTLPACEIMVTDLSRPELSRIISKTGPPRASVEYVDPRRRHRTSETAPYVVSKAIFETHD